MVRVPAFRWSSQSRFRRSRPVYFLCGLCQADHSAAKPAPVTFAEFAHEALVGSDKSTIALGCQCEVKAIICCMVELDGNLGCRLQKRTSRQKLDLGGLQKSGREQGLVLREFVPLNLLPKDIGTFSHQELGRNHFSAPS